MGRPRHEAAGPPDVVGVRGALGPGHVLLQQPLAGVTDEHVRHVDRHHHGQHPEPVRAGQQPQPEPHHRVTEVVRMAGEPPQAAVEYLPRIQRRSPEPPQLQVAHRLEGPAPAVMARCARRGPPRRGPPSAPGPGSRCRLTSRSTGETPAKPPRGCALVRTVRSACSKKASARTTPSSFLSCSNSRPPHLGPSATWAAPYTNCTRASAWTRTRSAQRRSRSSISPASACSWPRTSTAAGCCSSSPPTPRAC